MIPRTKALEAKALIESWQPDGVITADDKAAKYIIKPFGKEHTMPFVFCGINWTVQEYGFPHCNVRARSRHSACRDVRWGRRLSSHYPLPIQTESHRF